LISNGDLLALLPLGLPVNRRWALSGTGWPITAGCPLMRTARDPAVRLPGGNIA
jgi:hypothetical protein